MENPIFNSNIAAAVVGVIGTLLGTCLGWLLNELSQMGRLEIFKLNPAIFFYDVIFTLLVQQSKK